MVVSTVWVLAALTESNLKRARRTVPPDSPTFNRTPRVRHAHFKRNFLRFKIDIYAFLETLHSQVCYHLLDLLCCLVSFWAGFGGFAETTQERREFRGPRFSSFQTGEGMALSF